MIDHILKKQSHHILTLFALESHSGIAPEWGLIQIFSKLSPPKELDWS